MMVVVLVFDGAVGLWYDDFVGCCGFGRLVAFG